MTLQKKDANQRRRRNATSGFEQLDPNGRVAPAPEWPFGEPTPEEYDKWEELWRLPQAVKWEQAHAQDIVALYVRSLLAAHESMGTRLLAEVRALDTKLGISPRAMKELGWEIISQTREEPAARAIRSSDRVYIPD